MFVFRIVDTPHWVLVKPGPDGYFAQLPPGTGDPVGAQFGGRDQVPFTTWEKIHLLAGTDQPTAWTHRSGE